MPKIGEYATLNIVKIKSFGAYLDAGSLGEVLLPIRYVPPQAKVDDSLRVFLYCDSEDRVIATTDKPRATVGALAYLRVKEVTQAGAFLDWGLMKDLFVPFREQSERMHAGRSYWVKVVHDATTDRIIATSKLNRFLKHEAEDLIAGQVVKIAIAARTDLGYRVIVADKYWGVLYQNELFKPLSVGTTLEGFVKALRTDKRVDVILQKQGYEQCIPEYTEVLLQRLKSAENGFLPLTDASPPALIYEQLQMSKKNFKKSVGNLYKQRLIGIEAQGIRLL